MVTTMGVSGCNEKSALISEKKRRKKKIATYGAWPFAEQARHQVRAEYLKATLLLAQVAWARCFSVSYGLNAGSERKKRTSCSSVARGRLGDGSSLGGRRSERR